MPGSRGFQNPILFEELVTERFSLAPERAEIKNEPESEGSCTSAKEIAFS